MYQRILVPTDGSPLSKKAVKSAIGLAASLGSELVALHVVPHYATTYFEGGSSALSHADVGRIEKHWAEEAQALVDGVVEAAAAAGVQAKAAIAHADSAADAIVAAARKHKCDLLVMASHGHRGLKRLLLGSETLKVLTHSGIPVLVLR
ncbi:MAG: universal stress protein [Burkholderiales bacterium]|nr:universal stress protein [Burkholderiales bacterium]